MEGVIVIPLTLSVGPKKTLTTHSVEVSHCLLGPLTDGKFTGSQEHDGLLRVPD